MVHKWKVLPQWCQILGNGAWDPGLYREGYLAYLYTRFLIRQPQRKYAAHGIDYGQRQQNQYRTLARKDVLHAD